MNRIVFLSTLCLCLFSCTSQKTMTNSVVARKAEDIARFAEQAWDSVAKKIPVGMEEPFGFKNREEIENSNIGNPIRMFYWENGAMVASNDYRVPILVNGNKASLLTVSANWS